jgi:feruloyl-CoA synthase
MVGIPGVGLEVKLVPTDGKLEVRFKGPGITPGYWRQPDKTAESFDEEGFYMIGDAIKFVDEADPSQGFLFDGRVSEDFKLDTGTWVNTAAVRGALIAACAPYGKDAVLTGLDAPHVGALIFPEIEACRGLAPELAGATEAGIVAHPAVRRAFQHALDGLAAKATGSSMRVARAVVLAEPPAIDAHEVTDKGSINAAAVRERRAALVEDLYREKPPGHVIVAAAKRKAA